MKIKSTPIPSTATPVVLVEFYDKDFVETVERQGDDGKPVFVEVPAVPVFATHVVAPDGSDYEAMAMAAYQDSIAPRAPYIQTYQQQREPLYPSFKLYLDGVVKQHSQDPVVVAEGVAQVAEYAAMCLAVKAAVPKGI